MKGQDVLFSSATDQWATPQDFFDALDAEFHFTLDPCADETNHKCETYFTKEQDGLKQSWGGTGYSAIRHMDAKRKRGSEKRGKNPASRGRWSSCLSRPGQTRRCSTTTY